MDELEGTQPMTASGTQPVDMGGTTVADSLNDHPTTRQELERKVTDLLIDTVSRLNAGAMTASTAVQRTKTAYAIVAGLVSNDIMDLIEQVANHARESEEFRSIYLWHPKTRSVCRIRMTLDGKHFVVFDAPSGVERRVMCEPGTQEQRDRVAKLVGVLSDRGYQVI